MNDKQKIWEAYKDHLTAMQILVTKLSKNLDREVSENEIDDIDYKLVDKQVDGGYWNMYDASVKLSDGTVVHYDAGGNIEAHADPLDSVKFWDFVEVEQKGYEGSSLEEDDRIDAASKRRYDPSYW